MCPETALSTKVKRLPSPRPSSSKGEELTANGADFSIFSEFFHLGFHDIGSQMGGN
jgi:hypothetical protein